VLVRRRPYVAGNQDRYDEGVHGQDTRHDNGDERLHIELLNVLYFGGRRPTFMMRSGLYVPTPAMPIPDLAVP
jgi:hypothetical protein